MLYNLTIEGHHVDVTPALQGYVMRKLSSVTRHFDRVVSVAVTLSVERAVAPERRERITVRAHYKGKDIFVEKSMYDLYVAIDECMRCLDRQVESHKTRVQNHHHLGAKRVMSA
jgi:putative sigma-54 modulation protein